LRVLVTGGAGYIGSHFVKFLIDNNLNATVIDNLSRGHIKAVHPKVDFEKIDLVNYEDLLRYLKGFKFDALVHFAAFAYVGESVEKPDLYYRNNVVGSFNLIKAAVKSGIRNIVFSSTCSLYGNNAHIPISEDETVNPINPYARTKFIIEQILCDFKAAYGINYAALRYFNAAGADFQGIIGESHNPEPHLIPLIIKTALGEREKISIYGNDYPTKDGTCIRDYIHVYDLAEAHLKALNYLFETNNSIIVNLGTGKGYSVKEVIKAVEKVTRKTINIEITKRRLGDPAELVADNKKAKSILGWQPKYNLDDIILSAWNWHKNPKY
jgi:UDP-glucose 4-epimerase